MTLTIKTILEMVEGENCEFKTASENYNIDKLVQYACAIANCGGGKIIFGITDQRPRQIVGTNAFPQPERTRSYLIEHLHLRVELDIFSYDGKRVIVFSVPTRPVGVPIQFNGKYWTRSGDSLTSMSATELRDIFAESGHDFSADVCLKADWNDLDLQSIENFRRRWEMKSGNSRIRTFTPLELLQNCEAITRDGITYAGLILFGVHEALGRLLGQCEIIFEYRANNASGPAQFRQEFRCGFFSYYDQLWELINRRNDLQHFQDGFFIFNVPTFEERIVREAILNAVCHRNYQYSGSIFIIQYPQQLTIENPGGLPPDITIENILERQSPRNRRLADIFSKCGLVERSGQGMNLMYEWNIKQAKNLPNLSKTDKHRFFLTLDGRVQDPQFLVIIEKIGEQILETFSTNDFLIINFAYHEKPIPKLLRDRIPHLVELGIIETIGRGEYILAEKFYKLTRQKGTYTRKKGLNRNEQKMLLLKHIKSCGKEGCQLRDLCYVLPSKKQSQIKVLLKELRNEKIITSSGKTRAGRWFACESN
ncbi:MAG: putative DNA binding domain-containing protein [Planctomycetaceae bacterium]|jgi:ATP-dependent DNA helicase RecG|nr:putative DNA binding domain-containing protein [Planctomycetaceae bacterium]